MVESFRKGGYDLYTKKMVSSGFKILINYIQMISILSTFDLKWPYYAKDYLLGQSFLGMISTQIFNLECFQECIVLVFKKLN